MKIECPSCQTVYDIPEAAVPDPGRDVQCAACGRAWFLMRHSGAAGLPETPPAQRAPAPAAPRQPPSHPDADAALPAAPAPAPLPDAEQAPPRRPIDPSVMAILREEADFEARARSGTPAPAATAPGPLSKTDDTTAVRTPPAEAEPAPRRTRDGRSSGAAAFAADAQGEPPKDPAPAAQTAPGPARQTRSHAARAQARGTASGPEATGARDRLARLTEAERSLDLEHSTPDDGLVEDPRAALRTVRPPLLESQGWDTPPTTWAVPPGRDLPVIHSRTDLAVVTTRRRRVGFRIGFGVTAGMCSLAIAAYLLAALVQDTAALPLADHVLAQGDRFQTALVELVRRMLSVGLS